LRAIAFDAVYGLKDAGRLLGAESIPRDTDDAVDTAATHAISTA